MSVLRGERAPGEKWAGKDYLLAVALTTYEKGLCRGCGQPISHTTHGHDYAVETYTCNGCQELESSSKAKEREAGVKVYLRPEE